MHLVLEMLVQNVENSSGKSPKEEESGNQYERHRIVGAVHSKKSVVCFVHYFDLYKFYFSVSMSFQMPAAQAPPTNGPTMKIQRLASAVPPSKMAGAIERAGLTDVPV